MILTRTDSETAERMKRPMRVLSNVQQALENLITQCQADEIFDPMRRWAEDQLFRVNAALRREIHRG